MRFQSPKDVEECVGGLFKSIIGVYHPSREKKKSYPLLLLQIVQITWLQKNNCNVNVDKQGHTVVGHTVSS